MFQTIIPLGYIVYDFDEYELKHKLGVVYKWRHRLRARGYSNDDGGGGFAEDDVIFYSHFRANFCQLY